MLNLRLKVRSSKLRWLTDIKTLHGEDALKVKIEGGKKGFYSNKKANPMFKLYLSVEKKKYRFHIQKCQTLLAQILTYNTDKQIWLKLSLI